MTTATINILVEREWVTENSVCGNLIVGEVNLFTLEPPYRPDDVKPRAIPAGTYEVTLRYSPKHNRIMPHVENVPGFEGIEIHWGNYPKDTDGCLLVGDKHLTDYVGNSKDSFDSLFYFLSEMKESGADINITYRDPSTGAGQ